ncbi:NAD-dependent epimerase/dehydratase family protein [Prochlorococcus marinus]|uniref:NAD-dependent epimerase/dehydratase family protein n=1 Tax=Prochlorococcus marinus TaxID=1219 RepID=UPI0022B3DC19|nr:NAD-dependent epimerase/dehydratase family protein [Prochlorococcus marinus]
MKVLFYGGTRFVGKALVSRLLSKGHEIFVFTRGKLPVPKNITHLKGDRLNDEDLKKLSEHTFDLIVDSSGRKLEDTQRLLEFSGLPDFRFIYISSAGVYENTGLFPVSEESLIDLESRHIGKAKTESWLKDEGIPFTSFRPTYIYGPGNYNPIEKWFFDRITNGRSIPVPYDGQIITQLGHVSDLAEAISKSLETDKSINQIYNCSGTKAVTFKGLIETAILATGNRVNDFSLRSFDPSRLDPKARKLFPLRLTNFFTDTSKIEKDLSWEPKFDLFNGLIDSYNNDYLLANYEQFDFSSDELLFD